MFASQELSNDVAVVVEINWPALALSGISVASMYSATLASSMIFEHKSIEACNNSKRHLNELEFHNGEILANVWYKRYILRIDSGTGSVIDKIYFNELPLQNHRTGKEDCLNGIAYDKKKDNLLITGKWWSNMYRINANVLDAS